MTYHVHIISTGETIEVRRRGRNYQLWHDFLMSGYSDFAQWEKDGCPDEISLLVIREIVKNERIAHFDALEFFDELDRMTSEILREPVDWAAIRAEQRAQGLRDD